MSAGSIAGEHAQRELEVRVQALFQQGWIAVVGLPVVIVCLVAAMWKFAPVELLLGWLAATLASVALRVPVLRAYARDTKRNANAPLWARRYTWAVIAHGLCWACAPWLFLDPAQPFAVTSYVMIAALMPTTSIPTQSNYPPAVYWIVSLTVVPMIVRLLGFADERYLVLAATLIFYFAFLIIFARLQHKLLGAGIRLRLENASLIEALEDQRDNAEAQRERADLANHAKSQFLAAASHDLRQPLHALGLLGASLHAGSDDPSQRDVLERMSTAIDALESTFSELLDLSRIDAGYVKPRFQDFSLSEVFDRLRAYHGPAAAEKSLAFSLAGGEVIVHSDRALLERVLSNLASNAIRYTYVGSVSVWARADAHGTIAIEVRDTGIGIPASEHDRVFEEFVQLHNPERDRRKGLGLGLAIVRRICMLLDHPLELEIALPQGTCVRVRVPAGIKARSGDEPPSPAVSHDLLRGRRILLIEDDHEVATATISLLGEWKCDARMCANAREAPAAFLPELIVADLRLRDRTDGMQEVDTVRKFHHRQIPALIVTGDTAADTLRRVRERGFVLLHKPVRPAQLRAALSQLIVDPEAEQR
jgi:signal transduction histidine kinase/CheY-like chemotaxis protein